MFTIIIALGGFAAVTLMPKLLCEHICYACNNKTTNEKVLILAQIKL